MLGYRLTDEPKRGYSFTAHMLRTWQLIGAVLTLWLVGCARRQHADVPPQTPYHYPLNSPGGKFTTLPPAVQNTIRAEMGAEPIRDIRKAPGPVYKVFYENERLPPLLIAPDGSVLNADLSVAVPAAQEDIGPYAKGDASALKPGDLPPNVMKVAQERAPNTEIALIKKEKAGGRDVFVISFKDPIQYPTLRIADDGTVLSEPQK